MKQRTLYLRNTAARHYVSDFIYSLIQVLRFETVPFKNKGNNVQLAPEQGRQVRAKVQEYGVDTGAQKLIAIFLFEISDLFYDVLRQLQFKVIDWNGFRDPIPLIRRLVKGLYSKVDTVCSIMYNEADLYSTLVLQLRGEANPQAL
jgi:hypothetical protein